MNYNNDLMLGIQLVYLLLGILTATFIGSMGCGIWLLLSKGAVKFYVKDAMKYLQLVLVCFLLPIVPFVVYPMLIRQRVINGPYIEGPMVNVLLVIVGIWLAFVLFVVCRRLYNYAMVCKVCSDSIPIEDEEVLAQIAQWMEMLQIKRKVQVSLNPHISSPAILYHWGYQILLPTYEMTDKAISMVILHELVHLKHNDIFVKNICFIVNMIHGFNPFAKMVKENVVKWAEVLCDLTTCEIGKDSFTRQEYYYGIIELMQNAKREIRNEAFFSVIENKAMLEFRVEKFAEAHEPQQQSLRGVMYLVIFLMIAITNLILGTTMTVANAWLEGSLKTNEVVTEVLEEYRDYSEDGRFHAVIDTITDASEINCLKKF